MHPPPRNLTDSYRIVYVVATEHVFTSAHAAFHRINYIVNDKKVSKIHIMEIKSSMSSGS